MPNRILRETIADSESINALGDFDFRVWAHLIVYVDDYGRGDARPALIRGRCFPLRAGLSLGEIAGALDRLEAAGLIRRYTAKGGRYLYIVDWAETQVIRNKRSKFPPPDPEQDANNCERLQTIENNCDQLHANVSVIQSESESESVSGSQSVSESGSSSPSGSSSLSPARAQNKAPVSPPPAPPTPRDVNAPEPNAPQPVRPTPEQVRAYAAARGSPVDPVAFFDYYAANGWRMGKNPMRDWQAAFRSWERKEPEKPEAPPPRPPSYDMERAAQRMLTTTPVYKKKKR